MTPTCPLVLKVISFEGQRSRLHGYRPSQVDNTDRRTSFITLDKVTVIWVSLVGVGRLRISVGALAPCGGMLTGRQSC